MDLKKVYNFFTDCWRLYKKYIDTALDDDDCMKFVAETNQLRLKYEDNHFCNEILAAIANEMSRICKIRFGNKNMIK